ncbi:hypothetical protein [Clostridium psychrophilum]|uniref:hypothetical protein n=1 Tax=Clostridium psychrophilum TaxID=132926 RepID=UPI001C0C378B|nr:hypothetical protein [Clostridium psychrophilum]MBU3179818.1 hypothetical protein [Clostridium psychrophilum]
MGVYIVAAIGLFSVIFCGYYILKNNERVIDIAKSPGFVMFILFFVLAWWTQRGRMLTSWDEFSHWGTVVRNMYIFNAFGNHPEATTIFKGYPPATALLEYFWVKLSGSFTDGNLYRAMNMLYFALMLPVFSNLKWKQFSKIVIRFIFVLILPLAFFQDFYTNIMVDAILGVMFASILINYYVNEMDTFKIVNISLALFVLTITKAAGFGLAIISIIIMAVDLLFIKRKDLMLYINGRTKLDIFKKMLLVICPILACLISKYSWSAYLKLTSTDVAWDTSAISLVNIKRLFNGSAPHYQMITIKNFFNAFTEFFLTNYTLKISFMGWIVILIALSIILTDIVSPQKERARLKLATISIFIGAALYTLSLLILYLFTYSEYEAIKLASYSRYASTYLLGILIFIVVTICLKEQTGLINIKTSVTCLILLFLLLIIRVTPIVSSILLAPCSTKSTVASRERYAPINRVKGEVNPKTDSFYFISVASNGYDYWVSRYNITPLQTNLYPCSWSLGKPYYKGDVWSQDISANDWAKELRKEYTYVYIFKTNDIFNKNYGKLFEGGGKSIKNNTLYHVKKGNDSVVLQK